MIVSIVLLSTKISIDIKELSLDSMYKKLNKLNDEIINLKNVASRKKKNKVLSNAGDLYKNLYYAYKDKYNKEINSLDTKNREKLHYKKLRLSDSSFEAKQDEKQDDKQDEKQEEIQEKTKTDVNAFNEQIINEEADIESDVFFKYFSAEKPCQLFNHIYEVDNKNMIINIVNSELEDLKKEIKKMTKQERKTEKIDKTVKLVEEILKFDKQK